MYEPLSYPEGWSLKPSRAERIRESFPILGRFLTAVRENREISIASHHVRQQLEERSEKPSEVWPDDEKQRIANEIATICKNVIGWENDHFIPEDPFEIMIDLRIGDLVEMESIQKIEEEFSVDFKPLIDDGSLWKMTFQDVVARIRAERTKS